MTAEPILDALEVLQGTDAEGGLARKAGDLVTGATDAPSAFLALVAAGAADTPLDGSRRAQRRFRLLVEVGAADLSTVRLLEGHLDAAAILAELGGPAVDPGAALGVWASKAGGRRLRARHTDGGWRLDGDLAYCSGARCLDAALVVADAGGADRLFLVELDRPGVEICAGSWPAVGMAGSISETVTFDGVEVPASSAVGGAGQYVDRPGFWAGAVGVAACWAGGALGITRVGLAGSGGRVDPHRLAHLGAAVSDWAAMWTTLAGVAPAVGAGQVDELQAQVVRHQVEAGCQRIIDQVGRLTGPGPMVHDEAHARRIPDLLVYLRQHHGEADLERAGCLVSRATGGHPT